MKCVHFILLFLSSFGPTHCRLKDMGEVTNFSQFLDDKSYKLPSLLEILIKGKKIEKSNAIKRLALFKKKKALILGGEHIDPVNYSHSVIFINYQLLCSGSIISDTIVLTSAHCLDHNKNLLEMRVLTGAQTLFDHTATIHKVWDFIIHDRYNYPSKFSNNAALLIIHDKFVFNPTVSKALLINNRDWIKPGTVITVTGWGAAMEDSNSESKNEFRKADLTLLSREECRESAGTVVTSDMFCLWGNRTQATCRGDSGGGALWEGMIVGIVSHGGLCTEFPGLYTNVYYLREWIEKGCSKLYQKYCNFFFPHFGDY